jgi:putative sterol carrier protein
VAVKFLTEEWAQALKEALNADEAFTAAAAATPARLQQVITADGADTRYWIVIADGAIDMGVGELPDPDATITQGYESAVALAKNELNPVTAFMTGKIKIAGNMGLLLSLQGALARLPVAMSAIDVDY